MGNLYTGGFTLGDQKGIPNESEHRKHRGSEPLCFLYLFERAGEGVLSDSYSQQTGELLSAMSQLAHVLAVEWVGVYNGTVISRLCSAHS